MRLENIFFSIAMLVFAVSEFDFLSKLTAVEAKGKGKKCKIEFRYGEYVVRCPKKLPNKESQRTVTRRRGPRGKKGEKGSTGPIGPPGPKGETGAPGIVGAKGSAGPIGPPGVAGIPGSFGPRGIKGDQGEIGPTGSQGPPGMPGNCLSESPIYVQRNGVHCLPGPIGPQGQKGTSGPEGAQGAVGVKGEAGLKGQQGEKGPRGPVGLPGLPGTLGKIACAARFTEWIRQDDMYQMDSIAVLCKGAEFMQGFVVEMKRTDIRYKYFCCAFS